MRSIRKVLFLTWMCVLVLSVALTACSPTDSNFVQITPIIAAGGYHTVGVKSDGTVVAVGDNYYEQCNVGGWTDIVQVAAGGYHTVGLKLDGTAVAAGLEVELAQWDLF